ncbi:FAD-dependent oxidoreductase [Caldiplasma sukawensis]
MKIPDRVLIIGDGESAIIAANKLVQRTRKDEAEIILLTDKSYLDYKDGTPFVATSNLDHHELTKRITSVLRPEVRYIKDRVVSVDLNGKAVNTREGRLIRYEYLMITDPMYFDESSIEGFSEDARTLDTVQSSLSLKEDLAKLKKGNVVVYQDEEAAYSPFAGFDFSILAKSYVDAKMSGDQKPTITMIYSGEKILGSQRITEYITDVCKKNGINLVLNEKLKTLSVKNSELVMESGKTFKYDIPVIIGKGKEKPFIQGMKVQRNENGNIILENDFSFKGFEKSYLAGYFNGKLTNYWRISYDQLDYITGKIASEIGGYPEQFSYKQTIFTSLITSDNKASSISIEDGEIKTGRESKTDYLLKLYGFKSFFGSYAFGFI